MTFRASELGRWISELQHSDVLPHVIEKMRDHFLDTIAAAIVGDGRDPVRIADEVFDAPGNIPLLVDRPPRELRDAARINAVAAHAAEIDDTEGCDHTGAVVVPTLLAIFADDRFPFDGDRMLVSTVVGYEVGRRMQLALGGYDAHNETGWHSTATCGVFAAAAAAAHALALTPEQCTSALAFAASSSSGGWAFATDGSMSKQLHVAMAAGSGLQAALLARAGATGPAAVLDDVWGGFFTTHGAGVATPEELLAGLGARWHAEHSAIKMYAACRSAHPPLDGVVDLLAATQLSADQVTDVDIAVSPLLRPMVCPADPRTVEAARMSLPISIALLLLGEQLMPDAYARFLDDDVQELVGRMHITEATDLPNPQYVRVTLTVDRPGGPQTFTVAGDEARGGEHDPFSREAVHEKFRTLTAPKIGVERSEQLIAFVGGLGSGSADPLPNIWR